jgi:hypothetical protein
VPVDAKIPGRSFSPDQFKVGQPGLNGGDALSFGRVVSRHGSDVQFWLTSHDCHRIESVGDSAAQEDERIVGTAHLCSRDATNVLGSISQCQIGCEIIHRNSLFAYITQPYAERQLINSLGWDGTTALRRSSIVFCYCSECPHSAIGVDRHERPIAAVRHAVAMLQPQPALQTFVRPAAFSE